MTTLLSSSRRLLVYCLLLSTIAVANSENKIKKSKITKSKITKSSKKNKSHKRNGSDFTAFWYKPHYQCNGWDGSTPQNAANFINKQLLLTTPSDRPNKFAADFVGVSEWVGPDNIIIGNPDEYGTIGAVCGYGSKDYSTPVALFYKKETWEITKSYPASSKCNLVPVPPWTGPQFGADVCFDKVKPSGDNCCSCVYSEEEYAQGHDMGNKLGQRPWVGGIFQQKNNNEKKVCVIAGEVPHPLMNMMIYNIDGKIETSNPLPYTIQPYLCTLLNTQDCVPNLSKSSILYGTDVLVSGVNEFCGDDTPIVFMFDTNVGMGYVTTGSLFNNKPLNSLTDVSSLSPYTCCNDTATQKNGTPTYASDRISVSGKDLTIDKLQGGAVTSQGKLPGDMTYQCHCSEEHAPLRAHISFKK